MIRTMLALAVAAATLAACNRPDDGTSIAIDTGNGSGAAVDGKTGEVKIDTPIFKGALKLPKITMNADDFDVNGVHLFPGSRIENLDVAGQGKGDGTVTVRFNSPATPASVQDWFKREFEKKGMAVTLEGAGLRGTTEDEPFRIELTPDGATRSSGTVRIG